MGQQLLILALILDPLGFAMGYLLGPSIGVEPIVAGVYGLVVASAPLSVWVMHQSQ